MINTYITATRHYITIDSRNYITNIFSDAHVQPEKTDICINENGDRHVNDIKGVLLVNMDGTYNFKYIHKEILTISEQEKQNSKEYIEHHMNAMRTKRDHLLDEADLKYCNPEKWELMTEEQRQAWRLYKQALRDMPYTVDIKNIVYPEKPI